MYSTCTVPAILGMRCRSSITFAYFLSYKCLQCFLPLAEMTCLDPWDTTGKTTLVGELKLVNHVQVRESSRMNICKKYHYRISD